MGSVRNFAYAGYGDEDGIAPSVAEQIAYRRPSLIARFFHLVLITLFFILFVTFIGLMALIIKPELIPTFQAQVTQLIQKATGLSADEIEARRREYAALVSQHLSGAAKQVHVTVQGQTLAPQRMTLSERISAAVSRRTSVPREKLTGLAAQLVTHSKQAGLDPLLVAAIAAVESGFDEGRISDNGKLGLLQLEGDKGQYMSGVTKVEWKGTQELLNAGYNLELGTAYLKFLDKIFRGNPRYLLMAKSMGPRDFITTIKENRQVPAASVQFTDEVMNLYAAWQSELKTDAES